MAISPCPNDTFIFHHLIENGFGDRKLECHFEDVEELNRRALEEGRHAITKMSYHALLKLEGRYRLLSSGGALGRGCGPLLISGRPCGPEALRGEIEAAGRVLTPGPLTTASLLLRLFLKSIGVDLSRIRFESARYDLILDKLLSGEERFGVIIHEERFTYQKRGLHGIRDLGDWWEGSTGLPIPLGCIAVRSDVPAELDEDLNAAIRNSLLAARENPERSRPFVKRHAQALEDDVIDAHIGLYVNDFSLDLGDEGRRAVAELRRRA